MSLTRRDRGDAPPGPQLQLFAPDHEPDETVELTADVTLCEFFARWVAPVCLVTAARRNLDQYRQTLKLWRACTGDPPLRKIDDYTCAAFLRALVDRQLAANTIRKHCVCVQFCLDRAAPRGRHNRQGRNLIREAPYLEKPLLVRRDVADNFLLPEIAALLTACASLAAPRLIAGIDAADWWRGLFLTAYNTGLRIGTLLKLRWDWIHADDSGTWFVIPPEALKIRRGLRVPLNTAARRALEYVRDDRPAEALVFAWPATQTWLHCRMQQLHALAKTATNRRLGFHAFRKACATELGRYHATAAGMLLGHGANMTRDHYQNRVILAEALEQLPQPPWTWPAEQRRLFV